MVGHDSEIAFGFVEDVAQPGEVEDAALAELGVEVVVGESTHPKLSAAQLAVIDKNPDPVVEQLAGHRAKPQQASKPVYRDEGEQRDGAGGIGLGTGDGGAPDDGADRYRGGEIDDGPLGQGAPFAQPQPDNCGHVHEYRLAGDRT